MFLWKAFFFIILRRNLIKIFFPANIIIQRQIEDRLRSPLPVFNELQKVPNRIGRMGYKLSTCTIFIIFCMFRRGNYKYCFKKSYNARRVNCSILCEHIETSSLWAEFVNKNRCLSVRLVSEEDKSI